MSSDSGGSGGDSLLQHVAESEGDGSGNADGEDQHGHGSSPRRVVTLSSMGAIGVESSPGALSARSERRPASSSSVSGVSGVVDRRHEIVPDLGDDDRTELARLVRADPLVNAVVDSRLSALVPLTPRRFGGTLVGVRDEDGRLTAAAFSGGNLLPIGGDRNTWLAIAGHVAERPRLATSIVGRVDAVETMWEVLEPVWGAARAIRRDQPLLSLDRAVADRPDRGGPAGRLTG